MQDVQVLIVVVQVAQILHCWHIGLVPSTPMYPLGQVPVHFEVRVSRYKPEDWAQAVHWLSEPPVQDLQELKQGEQMGLLGVLGSG